MQIKKLKKFLREILPDPIVYFIQLCLGLKNGGIDFHKLCKYLFYICCWHLIPRMRNWQKKYNHLMKTGHIDRAFRKILKVDHTNSNIELRVSFLAGVGDMRVMRLAAAAQNVGIKVQLLIVRQSEHRNNMVRPEFFENVVWIDDFKLELGKITREIEKFGSHLVHCHMQREFNCIGVWLLVASELPVVCDAYDMVNVQYNPLWKGNLRWLDQNKQWERICYQNCDGICFRSPYRKIMEKRGIFLSSFTKYIHMPEPLLTFFYEEKKQLNANKKTILTWIWREEFLPDLRVLEQIWEKFNFESTLINCLGHDIDGISNNHKVINILKYEEYQDLLRKIDFMFMNPIEPFDGYYCLDSFFGHFGNKYVDLLEKQCVSIVPEYYRYVNHYFRKTGYFVSYNRMNVFNDKFWSDLYKFSVKDKLIGNEYFHPYQGKRLAKFYKSILGAR